jgi:trimeric autotransporter adhesin
MKKIYWSPLKKTFLICCLFISGCMKRDLTDPNLEKSISSSATSNALNNKLSNNWIINTICGNGAFGYTGDGGPALNASLSLGGVSLDRFGNIYIGDPGNYVIRKVDARTGIISTVAGNGILGYSGDGGPATQASLSYDFQTAVDDYGNLFISEFGNNCIRKVDKATGIITTVAGTGISGFNGDGKALSTNVVPFGIAFNKHGDLIFASDLRIRKLDMKTGFVTTIGGTGNSGFGGDGGPAKLATWTNIWNLVLDDQDNIYLTDQGNYRVRKIDGKTGIVTTIAGNGVMGNSGKGGKATNASLTQPTGVAVDNNGNVYISDEILSQVYQVDQRTGIINLIAGNGTNGFSGDGGFGINALLWHPNSLGVDLKGNVIVCDDFNNRIRKLTKINSVF